ncbi:MAG: hypothetical protein ACI3ZO_03820, partial [Candidatus Cryptobacteroides sp.]
FSSPPNFYATFFRTFFGTDTGFIILSCTGCGSYEVEKNFDWKTPSPTMAEWQKPIKNGLPK